MKVLSVAFALLSGASLLSGCGSRGEPPDAASSSGRQIVESKSSPAGGGQPAEMSTISGVISDSTCAFNHKGMLKTGSMGKDDISCTLTCADSGSKLVLAVPSAEKIYLLSDQEAARKFAGRSVTVSGVVNEKGKRIEVKEIKPE